MNMKLTQTYPEAHAVADPSPQTPKPPPKRRVATAWAWIKNSSVGQKEATSVSESVLVRHPISGASMFNASPHCLHSNPRSTYLPGSQTLAPPWSLGSNWLASHTKCQAHELKGAHLSEEGISLASLLSAQHQAPDLAPWLGIHFTRISILKRDTNTNTNRPFACQL